MSVSSITPTTNTAAGAAATTSAATQAGVGLAKDFNTFLTLLTTQLQHQDPLDPMKSNEFTQQLVSFTGVEQQINTNKNLESLISTMSSQDMSNAVSYLGREVTATGNKANLSGGKASWVYDLGTTAAQAQITVKDANGNTVYSGNADPNAGTHTFNWDGKGFNGVSMPDGTYSLSVDAKTADGSGITSNIYQKGVVTSVDTSSGQSQFSVNGLLIPRSSITSVGVPQTAVN